jgi:hypothetical protein
LHAGVSAKASERDKLERLCRYIARPPVSVHRLSLTSDGNVRYELKTPYRNGTTHIVFEPLDFISCGSFNSCAASEPDSFSWCIRAE